MSKMNNTEIVAQIVNDLLCWGNRSTSDAERAVEGAKVVVDNDCCCCLVVKEGRADFYFRFPLSTGPKWGYKHSYRAPRRPSDAARYLRHGRESMKEWGWEV